MTLLQPVGAPDSLAGTEDDALPGIVTMNGTDYLLAEWTPPRAGGRWYEVSRGINRIGLIDASTPDEFYAFPGHAVSPALGRAVTGLRQGIQALDERW